MRPWRIRVRQGRSVMNGMAFEQIGCWYLEGRYWTRPGAQLAADRWEADLKARRTKVGLPLLLELTGLPVVLVDVVHQREIPS